MFASSIFHLTTSSRPMVFFSRYFLTVLVGLGSSLSLLAQQPTDSELLKITSPKPNAKKTLALLEFQTVEVRYKNISKDAQSVSAIPYTNGKPTPGYGYRPAKVQPKDRGSVEVSFTCREPTSVDEIRVRMWDPVAMQEIAVISIPVQMMWEDAKSTTPQASGTKPVPAPVPKPVAGQPGMVRFELQGYEVSQDAAAKLFISHPGELDPKALLATTAALVGARKATVVKLPFIVAASGARGVVAIPVGGYSLEAILTRGRDGVSVDATYSLRRASDQSGMVNSVLSKMGGITFMGSLPGTSTDTVVLVFARTSEL